MSDETQPVGKITLLLRFLREYADVFRMIGVFLLLLLGFWRVPSALEDAKLKQAVHSSIITSIDSLADCEKKTKRDVAVYALDYLLKSRALDSCYGDSLIENVCCAVLQDYRNAGDASGIMRMLKNKKINIERYANRLAQSALTLDDIDIRGGMDFGVVYDCDERVSVKASNIDEIAGHIAGARVHCDKIVYILKNRTEGVDAKYIKYIADVLNKRIAWSVFAGEVRIQVDDTPRWITHAEVRFYHDTDRKMAFLLQQAVRDVFEEGHGGKRGVCALKDYSQNIQGKKLPEGVLEIAVPLPSMRRMMPARANEKY